MTSASGCVSTTTRTSTPSTTTPCGQAESGRTPLYWLAALPRPTYEQECAGLRARARWRRAIRDGAVHELGLSAEDLPDPLANDPLPEDRLYR